MKFLIPLLFCVLLLAARPVVASQAETKAGKIATGKTNCDAGPALCESDEGFCRTEMRGKCGKRRGDWYGARKSVANAEGARSLLLNYFAGHEYIVSTVIEKRWGFVAEILDKDGKVIDRVMIDKRSGRIRSLY